jgi:hypothetical protein
VAKKNSFMTQALKNVSETISRATSAGKKAPAILGFCFPTVLLENVSHKPMIQQFLSSVPIVFPESVWNIRAQCYKTFLRP